jgi:hypothetical protein
MGSVKEEMADKRANTLKQLWKKYPVIVRVSPTGGKIG